MLATITLALFAVLLGAALLLAAAVTSILQPLYYISVADRKC